MTDMDQEPPCVRPGRYFDPVNSDEAESFRLFSEGVLLAFGVNMENGIPPYVIIGGTLRAVARFLDATVRPERSDDVFDGVVTTFARLVEATKLGRTMGETRQ